MLLIQMGTHYCFEPASTDLLGKLHPNLMYLFWGHLPRLERLDDVIPLYPVFGVPLPFCLLHFLVGFLHIGTLHSTYIPYLSLLSIFYHYRLSRLLLICGVGCGLVQPLVYGKDFNIPHPIPSPRIEKRYGSLFRTLCWSLNFLRDYSSIFE